MVDEMADEEDSIVRQMNATGMMVLVEPLGLISINRRGFGCTTDECDRYDGFGRATRSYFDQQKRMRLCKRWM